MGKSMLHSISSIWGSSEGSEVEVDLGADAGSKYVICVLRFP